MVRDKAMVMVSRFMVRVRVRVNVRVNRFILIVKASFSVFLHLFICPADPPVHKFEKIRTPDCYNKSYYLHPFKFII